MIFTIIIIVMSGVYTEKYIRGFINDIAIFHLGKDVVKERKKGQTFKEWFTFSRFREVIPDEFIRYHNIITIVNPVCFIAYMFMYVLKFPSVLGTIILIIIYFVDFGIIGILRDISSDSYKAPKKYKRRITKKQGQQPYRKRKK